MSLLYGIGMFLGVTGAGIIWFYFLLYNWIWLGLVDSTTYGWILGYLVLFIIFFLLSIPVIILLLLGYLCSITVMAD